MSWTCHILRMLLYSEIGSCNIYTCNLLEAKKQKRAETIVNETHIYMYNIMDSRKAQERSPDTGA